MKEAAYLLCALTALACCLLLWRGYVRTKVRLSLWVCLFFLALTVENTIVFVDLVILPNIDFSLLRSAIALIGVVVLLYGLTWEDS